MGATIATMVILGCIVLFACAVAVWINNTPSSDEIDDATMKDHLKDYAEHAAERRARRAAREAEDKRRLQEG